MLKKLTPRHKEIIRRLIVGETPKEISEGLGMHPATIDRLQSDPVFAAELNTLEQRANHRLTDAAERLDALKIIDLAAGESAQLCRQVVGNKVPDAPDISIDLRVKSAWDILDRKGHGKIAKSATVNISDLIIEASRQREAGGNG